MTSPLAATAPVGSIFRVGRRPDAWSWPPWQYAGDDGMFGNRYDDPAGEYRVLYASSQRIGAFLETLARFRVDPAVAAALAQIAGDPQDAKYPTIAAGVVPRDWLVQRRAGTARHPGPFADVAHSDSLAHLRTVFAARLVHYDLDDLDAGDLRRRTPRGFTQEVSRYVFEHGRDVGGEQLVGIRYGSRLGDELENWAIFEGSEPLDTACQDIADDDPDLLAALGKYDLRLQQPT